MKVLWASNSPTVGTGYGTQTAMFAPRIKADGHDVALYQSWGGDGLGVWKWEGMHVYPTDHDWGNRTMYACAAHHGQGALTGVQVIALCDAWVLRPNHFPAGLRLAIWAPVDHRPMPPGVRNVLKHEAVTPIAMSHVREEDDAGRRVQPAVCAARHRHHPVPAATREQGGDPWRAGVAGVGVRDRHGRREQEQPGVPPEGVPAGDASVRPVQGAPRRRHPVFAHQRAAV
jgi:hypothetical protein